MRRHVLPTHWTPLSQIAKPGLLPPVASQDSCLESADGLVTCQMYTLTIYCPPSSHALAPGSEQSWPGLCVPPHDARLFSTWNATIASMSVWRTWKRIFEIELLSNLRRSTLCICFELEFLIAQMWMRRRKKEVTIWMRGSGAEIYTHSRPFPFCEPLYTDFCFGDWMIGYSTRRKNRSICFGCLPTSQVNMWLYSIQRSPQILYSLLERFRLPPSLDNEHKPIFGKPRKTRPMRPIVCLRLLDSRIETHIAQDRVRDIVGI